MATIALKSVCSTAMMSCFMLSNVDVMILCYLMLSHDFMLSNPMMVMLSNPVMS